MSDNFFAQFDGLRSSAPPPSPDSGAAPTDAATPVPPVPPVPDDGSGDGWVPGPDGRPIPRITIRPTPPAAPETPPQPSGQNFFAQFDGLRQGSSNKPSTTGAGIVENVGAGSSNAIADALGAPVDALSWALNKGGEGINYASRAAGYNDIVPQFAPPVGGSDSIKSAMGLIGADPRDVPANTTAEKIARAAGGGIASMIAPEAAVGLLGRAGAMTPAAVSTAGKVIGSSTGLGDVAASGAIGATAGTTGETAAELSPPEYQPLARTVGTLAGGAAGALATAVPGAVGQAVRGARDFVAPMTESGQQSIAANTLAKAATNLPDVRNALAHAPEEIVPGSQPTTFQLTGDMGLGSLERDIQTRNPADFAQRRAEQNTARTQALTGIQSTGSAADVANSVRSSLADIDNTSQAAVESATQGAQTAAQNLGGELPPDAYGAQIRGQVQPQVAEATDTARAATQGLGGAGAPEEHGAAIRGALQDAENTARTRERALWSAVDPDNSLTVSMAPVQSAAQRVYGNLPAASEIGLSPAERQIQEVIGNFHEVEPFQQLGALRTEISSQMRQELSTAGRTPAYARLSQLRGAVEDSISGAVEQRAEEESQAVAAGRINPEQTIAASVQRQIDEWRTAKASAVGAGDQPGIGGPSSGRAATISRVNGAASQGRGRPTNASGDQGIQGIEASAANFDEAARERLSAATTATRERAQTFNQGPVGNVLRSQGMRGQYRLPDSSAAAAIFHPGAGGAERVQAFRHAVGNDGQAMATLQNYAAASLRRAAERPDGTLDPERYERWQAQHQDALRALPGLNQRFATAARASQAVERFAAAGGDLSLSSLPQRFFHSGPTGGEGVAQLRDLIGDENARPILTDYAASRVRQAAMRPDGTLDPVKTENWIKQHGEALRTLPEVADSFRDAASATRAIEDVAATRKSAMDDYQRGAVGKLLGATSDDEVTKTIGGLFGKANSAKELGRIAAEARRDPAAEEGLRKAVIDHLYSRFVSNTEAGTSGAGTLKSDTLQTFVRQNREPLRQVLSDGEINTLSAIGADLRRANRSLSAVRIPGQSNTAQDQASQLAKKGEGHGSLLQEMILAGAAGLEVHGTTGAVAGVGGVLAKSGIGRMREAGMQKIGDLVKRAMLDPEFARVLLAKVPDTPEAVKGLGLTFANQMRRLSLYSAASRFGDKRRVADQSPTKKIP